MKTENEFKHFLCALCDLPVKKRLTKSSQSTQRKTRDKDNEPSGDGLKTVSTQEPWPEPDTPPDVARGARTWLNGIVISTHEKHTHIYSNSSSRF